MPPPDIVLLDADWRSRAPLRAQLIEDGFEVVATEDWPTMRRQLRPGSKPGLAIVDLKNLPDPEQVLDDLRVLMKPERVLVLTAMGTVPPSHIEGLGFRVVHRPVAIKEIIATATEMIRSAGGCN